MSYMYLKEFKFWSHFNRDTAYVRKSYTTTSSLLKTNKSHNVELQYIDDN